MDVHRVAPAAAGVEHDRQLAGGAHVDRDVRHLRHRDVRLGDAFDPAERAAGEIDRLETGFLGHLRHDRIEHHRRDDEFVPPDQVLELLQAGLPVGKARPAAAIPQPSIGSMGKAVAKLKVMSARSMHEVVTALAFGFTSETGHQVELSTSAPSARWQKRLDAGETADVLAIRRCCWLLVATTYCWTASST